MLRSDQLSPGLGAASHPPNTTTPDLSQVETYYPCTHSTSVIRVTVRFRLVALLSWLFVLLDIVNTKVGLFVLGVWLTFFSLRVVLLCLADNDAARYRLMTSLWFDFLAFLSFFLYPDQSSCKNHWTGKIEKKKRKRNDSVAWIGFFLFSFCFLYQNISFPLEEEMECVVMRTGFDRYLLTVFSMVF